MTTIPNVSSMSSDSDSTVEGNASSKKIVQTQQEPCKPPVLSSAPPPYHSILTWIFLTCLWLYVMPSWQKLDEIATIQTFTHRIFPELISVRQMACLRFAFAAVIWTTTIYIYFGKGTELRTFYLPGSKLQPAVIPIKGFKTLFPYTMVNWYLLGTSFTLSGYIAWNADQEIPDWVLRTAVIVWETCAPNTALVSAIVRYAIWPQMLKQGSTDNLKTVRGLLQHNFNVFAFAVEYALLGGLPIRWSEFCYGPLLGNFYSVLMWSMGTSWVDVKSSGPQFIYFFYDTTLPGFIPTAALLGVLAVCAFIYSLFVMGGTLLTALPGLANHVLFVGVVCGLVMRFRD